jgi:hypothetical protein
MSTRERINKTRGRSVLIALTGFLDSFSVSVIAQETYREFATALFFVGFTLFGGAIIYAIFTGRCAHWQRISILLSKGLGCYPCSTGNALLSVLRQIG